MTKSPLQKHETAPGALTITVVLGPPGPLPAVPDRGPGWHPGASHTGQLTIGVSVTAQKPDGDSTWHVGLPQLSLRRAGSAL